MNGNFEIEDLFSEEDRQKFDIEHKSFIVSSSFRNRDLKESLSKETKNNFTELLKYLSNF